MGCGLTLLRLCLLLWKNWVYRRRNCILTCLELFLVPAYVLALTLTTTMTQVDDVKQDTMPEMIYNISSETDLVERFRAELEKNHTNITVGYVPASSLESDIIQAEKIINELKDVINISPESSVNFQLYKTEKEMDSQQRKWDLNHERLLLVGIIFHNLTGKTIKYTLRFDPVASVQDKQLFVGVLPSGANKPKPGPGRFVDYYLQYAGLQLTLEKIFANMLLNASQDSQECYDEIKSSEVRLQAFPYPKYKPPNPGLEIGAETIIILVPLCFTLVVISLIRGIVTEKESGFKALLILYGVPHYLHAAAWFISTYVIGFFTMAAGFTILLIDLHPDVPAVYENSDPSVLFLIIACYVFQSLALTLFVASFFKTPHVAITAQFLVSVLFSFLPIVMGKGLDNIDLYAKLALCCLPNIAFNLIMNVFSDMERQGTGGQWVNIMEPIDTARDLAMGYILPVMIGTAWIYIILSCYLENVLPTKYGVSKPFYYPFLRSTWCSRRKKEQGMNSFNPTLQTAEKLSKAELELEAKRPKSAPVIKSRISKMGDVGAESMEEKLKKAGKSTTAVMAEKEKEKSIGSGGSAGSPFEPDPIGLETGVAIQNVRKEFFHGKNHKKVAVDGVSLNLYHGQITVLLGHNGAGKTTLISILTGLETPTTGTAIINGHDITTDIEEVQKNLSLCPQMNMLYNEFTVADHLLFFARLKGLGRKESKKAMEEQLTGLGLKEKQNVMARKLSGGQKRRVQLGMALIGGAKVVFLDEPTSGMDPEARREMWDVLLEIGKNRTICLTTHFMEEADVLGDRIAIMEAGQVKCCGTPLFLKHHYGTGYTLHVTLGSTKQDSEPRKGTSVGNTQEQPVTKLTADGGKKVQADAKVESAILSIVRKHLQRASLKKGYTHSASQVDIVLPMAEGFNLNSIFPAMFQELYANRASLNIEDIGLEITTMDDVFSEVMVDRRDFEKEEGEEEIIKGFKDESGERNKRNEMGCCALHLKQFYALLVKKLFSTLNKKSLFMFQIVIPILLTFIVVLFVNRSYQPIDPLPQEKINLAKYKDSITLFSIEANEEMEEALEATVGGKTSLRKITKGEGGVLKELLAVGRDDLFSFRVHHIVAFDVHTTHIKGLYSTLVKHSGKLAINTISNWILEKCAKGKDLRIELANHPLADVGGTELAAIDAQANTKPYDFFAQAALMLFGFAVVHSTFIIIPLEEKVSKCKQLQMMTGVSPITYWLSFFVWDFTLCLFILSVMTGLYPILQGRLDLVSHGGGGTLFCSFAMFSISHIIFIYFVSMFLSSAALGFICACFIQVVVLLAVLLMTILSNLADVPDLIHAIQIVIRAFPLYEASAIQMLYWSTALANSRCELISKETLKDVCDPKSNVPAQYLTCCSDCKERTKGTNVTCYEIKDYLEWELKDLSPNFDPLGRDHMEGIGQELTILAILTVIYSLILLLVEFKVFGKICKRKRAVISDDFSKPVGDEDIVAEANRVEQGGAKEDLIMTANFCKKFGRFAAVSNVSFGVRPGECFGLLGVNGAGKTTMFRMLTGDLEPTSGSAFASDGVSLTTDRKKYLRSIGYCPQFDAFLGVLTGKQMLELFARLRGVPRKHVHSEAQRWLHKLGLEKSGDAQCGNYSGGMQRRLSAAMAMIGDPPVVMLDEPTSGVDPVSRRQFWKVITSLENTGQAIILTSHSMDECEALCARLAIMVNGQLQCLGSVEHLKNKFAQGKSLDIKLKSIPNIVLSPQFSQLQNDVSNKFKPCSLKESHQNFLHYSLMNKEMLLDQIFSIMEGLANAQGSIIEEYSVSETTLEQVFLAFARSQYPERKTKGGCCKKCKRCKRNTE